MRKTRPDLIVPIRDRRQHKRYLTARNVLGALVAMAVIFAAITLRSEMRPTRADAFGRLFERELPKVEAKPLEVVTEAAPPISDHTSPDPMLVAPAAREQWLRTDDSATTSAALQPVTTMAPATIAPRVGEGAISIVGGPEGVSVVRQQRKRQVLSGGFGRP